MGCVISLRPVFKVGETLNTKIIVYSSIKNFVNGLMVPIITVLRLDTAVCVTWIYYLVT